MENFVFLLLQCKAKASQLPQGISFGLVLVSPFMRCAQTAASLLPHVQLDLDAVVQFHRWAASDIPIMRHRAIQRCGRSVATVSPRMSQCRGLSEVHCHGGIFPKDTKPSICQRFALWRWRRSRQRKLLSEFGNMAGVSVQVDPV